MEKQSLNVQDPINEVGAKNNYLLGTIGALIGAFVGTIPWFLFYTLVNLMIVWAAILIAIASYYGYKITKAKIDKKLPVIITICSMVSIIVTTLVVIPIIALSKSDMSISFDNFKLVYEYSGFMHDFIISILFTGLGISGVVANLYKQIKDGVSASDIKINASANINIQQYLTPEEIEVTKNIFKDNQAMQKDGNKLSKEEVLENLNKQMTEVKSAQVFNILRQQGIILKSKGKFYFSEKNALHPGARQKKIALITVAVCLVFIAAIIIIGMLSSNKSTTSSKNNSTTKASNITSSGNSNNVVYETEHVIQDSKIKFVPTEDMIILTPDEINQYMGAGYSDWYEIVSMNLDGSKLLYCFVIENEKNQTAEEYLKESLGDLQYDEFKMQNIAGVDFANVTLTVDEEGDGIYKENCYVYQYDNKFLCFDYWIAENIENTLPNMIQKIK